mmetsp:Transcript_25935/g.86367  ORF Transcript_25935/g.86367 Transcript_25935/m.86367 type:complete len:92 (-) Transcript_25935:57-332(-)
MYKIARPGGTPALASPSKAGVGSDDAYMLLARKHNRQTLKRIVCMILTMLSLVALPVVYLRYLQQVLPGYKWDVHGPCESRMSALLHVDLN